MSVGKIRVLNREHLKLTGRCFGHEGLVSIQVDHGRIASVEPVDHVDTPEGVQRWIVPGFVDLQVNGYGGHSFADPHFSVEQVREVAASLLATGVCQFLPTVVTADVDAMCRQVSVISEAMEVDALVARMCPGVHIEGPFINPEDGPRGAHDRRHVRQPDLRLFDLLVNAARGKVAMMTLAPELPGADELIQYARRQGVVVAIGHHRADAEAIAEAVRLGASGCTHLGNGSDAMVPRLENYIWAQLGEDGLWASFIADGQHIPAATLRCMIRAKTPERSMLVTDATAATGMPPGRYKLGDIEVEQLASGKVTLPGTPYLAGSSADMPTVIEFAIRGGGVSFEQAIRMASIQPLAVLSTGMIRRTCTPGQPAALVELDYAPQQERIVIRQTVLETWSTSTVGD